MTKLDVTMYLVSCSCYGRGDKASLAGMGGLWSGITWTRGRQILRWKLDLDFIFSTYLSFLKTSSGYQDDFEYILHLCS